MSDEFSANMKRFFGAQEGAYSIVTGDEHYKSQITFVGPEQELAERFFGKQLDLRHGNIKEIEGLGFTGTETEFPNCL